MRVAALYDVHGNLPALEAVLAELAQDAADHVVVGGDIAAGPMPRETLDRLAALGNVIFVRGNADRELLDPPDGASLWEARARWAAEQLAPEQRQLLAGLPTTAAVEVDGLGRALFCHGTPRSDEEIVTALTPESRLREILEGVDASLVVCGHTHVQFDRLAGPIRLVNAGSVGMPYEDEPGAYWAELGPEVRLRRTAYDLARAAAEIRATGFPDAEGFAREQVLSPPSAREATEHFERLAERG